MEESEGAGGREEGKAKALRVRDVVLGAAAYVASLGLAMPGVLPGLGEKVPGRLEGVSSSLWTLNWYERCVVEKRIPFYSPDLSYPVGQSIGYEAPRQGQGLLYVVLGRVIRDASLRYKVIWVSGFVLTGLSVFGLAWWIGRDRGVAWLGGLMGMLGGGMTWQGQWGLDLVFGGLFGVFLGAWMGWVERGGGVRLVLAAGGFVGVAFFSPAVAAMVVPGGGLAWFFSVEGEGWRGWFRSRWRGLGLFVVLAVGGSGLLLAGPVWGTVGDGGRDGLKSVSGEERVGWRAYLTRPVGGEGLEESEGGAYLGLVTIGLLVAGVVRGLRGAWRGGAGEALGREAWCLRRERGLWLMLVGLIVWSLGGQEAWGRSGLPRIGLCGQGGVGAVLVSGVAAVLAAGVLSRMLRGRSRGVRGVVLVGLAVVVMADLGDWRYPGVVLPEAPAGYRALMALGGRGAFVEVPQGEAGGGPGARKVEALAVVWQASHRGRTTAGLSDRSNERFGRTVGANSPFLDHLVRDPGYGEGEEMPAGDLAREVRLRDWIWLFLETYQIEFVALHGWVAEEWPEYRGGLERLERVLGVPAMRRGDGMVFFGRRNLPAPEEAVSMPTDGWSARWVGEGGQREAGMGRRASLSVYAPHPDRDLEFVLRARARGGVRRVRLTAGAGSIWLAEWDVRPEGNEGYRSAPFRLPIGRHELQLEVVELTGPGVGFGGGGQGAAEGERERARAERGGWDRGRGDEEWPLVVSIAQIREVSSEEGDSGGRERLSGEGDGDGAGRIVEGGGVGESG